ncbi:hypothetical protein Drorol1_Dr00014632 [Drosera rotundifolia]
MNFATTKPKVDRPYLFDNQHDWDSSFTTTPTKSKAPSRYTMNQPTTSTYHPSPLQEIIDLFQSVQEPKAKYQQLLFYAKKLPPFDKKYQTNDNKVQGCVSQTYADESSHFGAEAFNAVDVNKGESSGSEAIVRDSNKGPNRVNRVGSEPGLGAHDDAGDDAGGGSDNESWGGGGDSGSGRGFGSRGERIREKLERELKPVELVIEEVSYQHAGHAGVRGRTNEEIHFNVYIVSEAFEGKSWVKRHQMIYSLLQDELQNGLHALSIVAKTPSEVAAR